ncbi:hypothetical protein BY458DRAFT_503209 [Sporodiniella umbellata]|nr:hypothetical protein BY458DRAFT_503209 [Sporodiniella umbellata]
MKRYKMTASFFGVCGLIAVPGLASTGQAPLLSVALGMHSLFCFVLTCFSSLLKTAGISAISPAIFVHFYTRGYVTKLIVYDDIKKVERERKRPKEMKDKYIGLETISFWGRFKEQNMWLSQLKHKSTTKGLVWEQKTGAKSIFTLEREIMEADPYLNALTKRVQKREI